MLSLNLTTTVLLISHVNFHLLVWEKFTKYQNLLSFQNKKSGLSCSRICTEPRFSMVDKRVSSRRKTKHINLCMLTIIL